MKSAYTVDQKEKKRTDPAGKKHNIPTGMNVAQQIAYVNARLDAAQAEFDEQQQGLWDAFMVTILWTLHEEFGFGAERLERAYKKMVMNRAVDRANYRRCDKDKWGRDAYVLQKSGQNIEDFAYKAALRSIGFDYDDLESRAYFADAEKGIIAWRDKE